jgi:hypothetical protein
VGDEKKLDWLIGRMTSTTAKGTCEDWGWGDGEKGDKYINNNYYYLSIIQCIRVRMRIFNADDWM